MRPRLVSSVLGAVLRPGAVLFLVPFALDLGDGNGRGAIAFALGGAICFILGIALGRPVRPLPVLQRSEALAVVVFAWLLLSMVGAVPFVAHGYSLVDGLFESMSGYTTTGASIVTDYAGPGRGFFLWRALTNWVGGAGVVSLFVLVLPSLGVGGRQLFLAQSAASPGETLSPQVRRMAWRLLLIYVVLTGLQTGLLVATGMALYDSVLHSMSTLATGGFSPHSASLAGYANPAAEWVITVFMFLGATSFVVLAMALRRGVGRLFGDGEFRLYLGVVVGITAAVAFLRAGGLPDLTGLREAAFNVVSLVSSTGFASADFDRWDDGSRVLLMVGALLGGCAASTAGGPKLIRYLVTAKFLRREIVQTLHPSAVLPIRYNRTVVAPPILRAVVAVLMFYLVGYLVVGTVLVVLGNDMLTAYTAGLACLNNVGPGLGQVGPMASFAGLSDASKLVLTATMLLGRLEIVAVLVLLHPDSWRGTRWRTAPRPPAAPAPPEAARPDSPAARVG